ncbi:MAG: hypothetical protein KBT03_00300 [Bacteroidales bacterium]|nr:hypothetical protein [Candidatus Scybalousia scybalohippi]
MSTKPFNFYATPIGSSYKKNLEESFDSSDVDVTKEYFAHEVETPKYPKNSKVLVLDGDVISFKVAAVSDDRVIVVKKNNTTKEFKNRTEFKKLCKLKGWDYDSFVVTDLLKPVPIENCLGVLKRAVKNAMERVKATHFELYIGGSGNFRDQLPLPEKYKGSRTGGIRPTYLSDCKDYLIKYKGAKRIKGRECDDFVQQRMFELNQQGIEAVLYSNDKDARIEWRYPITIYNPDKDDIVTYKDGLGELWIQDGKHLKGSGLKWLISQSMIVGDVTDCYLPRHFFNKQYGAKTWYKDVCDIEDTTEFLQFAVDKFKSLVGDEATYTDWTGVTHSKNWLEVAEMYFSCAYMRVYSEDETTLESLLKEHDVEY